MIQWMDLVLTRHSPTVQGYQSPRKFLSMMEYGFKKFWINCVILMSVLCATGANSGEWSEWSVCSQSCGGGSQTRNRTCFGCVERRICNDRTCRIGTTAMIWVVMGVSFSTLTIIVIVLVGIFFMKEKTDTRKAKNVHKSSVIETTPGSSRRTPIAIVDSSNDIKLNAIRRDPQVPPDQSACKDIFSTSC